MLRRGLKKGEKSLISRSIYLLDYAYFRFLLSMHPVKTKTRNQNYFLLFFDIMTSLILRCYALFFLNIVLNIPSKNLTNKTMSIYTCIDYDKFEKILKTLC